MSISDHLEITLTGRNVVKKMNSVFLFGGSQCFNEMYYERPQVINKPVLSSYHIFIVLHRIRIVGSL